MPSNYKELYVSEYQNLKEKFIISELPCFFEENELKIIKLGKLPSYRWILLYFLGF